jgi:hypothetical protein
MDFTPLCGAQAHPFRAGPGNLELVKNFSFLNWELASVHNSLWMDTVILTQKKNQNVID